LSSLSKNNIFKKERKEKKAKIAQKELG